MTFPWRLIGRFVLYIFAAIGFFLTAGWAAVNWHLTDTGGRIDRNDRYFARSAASEAAAARDPKRLAADLCRAIWLKKSFPENGARILAIYERSRSAAVLRRMVAAAELYAKENETYAAGQKICADPATAAAQFMDSGETNLFGWINTAEWQTMKEALAKDKEVIDRVSHTTGVPARLIAAQIVGEQLRLFHDNREVFKKFFQPLKILGNEVQFSLGVAGIKEDTAKQIEKNLTDRTAVTYLGSEYERLLDFKSSDPDRERYERLTDPHDRYYSYLYTALFLKQIEKQWQTAGYDISERPEILATIFNLGFTKSLPKADPQVGGSEIEINGRSYTFGALSYEFFYSGELADEFPLTQN